MKRRELLKLCGIGCVSALMSPIKGLQAILCETKGKITDHSVIDIIGNSDEPFITEIGVFTFKRSRTLLEEPFTELPDGKD